MRTMLAKYRKLDGFIIDVLMAEFFLQMVNASFTLLINFYMHDQGYKDFQIANFISYRFLAVMLFAFPFGLFIKGRKLKPFFYVASIGAPLMAFVVIYAVGNHLPGLVIAAFVCWGIAYTCLQVTSLPFIILNSPKEDHPQAIALFFLTTSMAIFITGTISFVLNHFFAAWFPVKTLLQIFAVTGFIGAYYIYKIRIRENVSVRSTEVGLHKQYDWHLIIPVVVPSFIISAGAGLTIQFVNLFFLNVHGMHEDIFSLLGAFSFLLVAMGVFIVPQIKDRFGYNVAITLVQALAIFFLVLMALTEFVAQHPYAVWLAIIFFIIRQPLMNVAGPMTSELTINYVGKRNQELVSALNAAIWSGCWFISSQMFSLLRASGLKYAYIFMITAALYMIGVVWYAYLIKDFHRRKREGLIVD